MKPLSTERRSIQLNDSAQHHRIVIVGCSGSGKTSLARQIAQALDIPHIELDALYWLPNWQERPTDEFRALTEQAAAQERWVADGNYSPVRDFLWSRATAILWLNYSFPLVFRRVLWRTLRRVISREELFSGNCESFRMSFFSRDSILLWVLTSFRHRRQEFRTLFDIDAFPQSRKIELTHPRQAEDLLRSFVKSNLNLDMR